MATIRIDIGVTVIETNGEETEVRRHAITRTGDNPRFWSKILGNDGLAVLQNIVSIMARQWGTQPEKHLGMHNLGDLVNNLADYADPSLPVKMLIRHVDGNEEPLGIQVIEHREDCTVLMARVER